MKIEWIPLSIVAARLAQAHHTGTMEGNGNGLDMRARAKALLKTGCDLGASDIDIRRLAGHAVIEMHIDGTVREYDEITTDYADKLINALYMLTKQQYRPKQSQDGSIAGRDLMGTGLVNVRIARTPIAPVDADAQWLNMRLQAGVQKVPAVDALKGLKRVEPPPGKLDLVSSGWTEKQAELLQTFVLNATGTVIFTGPPGSGKTHVLHRLSEHIARTRPGQRQAFIEQPVETILPHAPQLNILDTLTAKRRRSLCAQNPPRSAYGRQHSGLGEIRDPLVATTWLSAAETGMLMMSTMHTAHPFLAIPRLRDMDPDRLALPIICDPAIICGLVGQRLVPILCDHCALPWDQNDPRLTQIMRNAILTWQRPDWRASDIRRLGPGCPHCAWKGTVRRQVVAEVVDPDETLMADFIQYGPTLARHRYHTRSNADTTMLEKGMGLVFQGRMDPFDVPLKIERIRAWDFLQRERERALKGLETTPLMERGH
ncbi:ATPase, T2SS/T4P/T4SS family [Acetobacter papayae]|uniref:ATPase, T2SS/T4P/T4SS family n=1 Tax=Acetobacter papayae TaxID=1076592 RepID=UPI000471A406|nr:ATPase, T2SS/T4P/T4SS family [Acetobacter papayae]